MNDKIYIVMPAYNESENIKSIVEQWHPIIEKIGGESKLLIVDDESKDDTYLKLQNLSKVYPFLEVITKPNTGHGRTCIFAYHYALDSKADWIFQTDSDGQTVPNEFWEFWLNRTNYNYIIGKRENRLDGWDRVFVTKILKFILYLIFSVNVPDANTPFRLIKADTLSKLLKIIPSDSFLSNVLISTVIVKFKVPTKWIKITFKPRQAGINSINFKRIIKIGFRAIKDFVILKKKIKENIYIFK